MRIDYQSQACEKNEYPWLKETLIIDGAIYIKRSWQIADGIIQSEDKGFSEQLAEDGFEETFCEVIKRLYDDPLRTEEMIELSYYDK